MQNLHPQLNLAIRAALDAGKLIHQAAQRKEHKVSSKGLHDYVTDIDLAAERLILDTLLQAYPHHAALSEEAGWVGAEEAEQVWLVDPLDGTTNFIHGFAQFAVSIALRDRGRITQAVVYDPSRNDLYVASRGRGAYLNDHRIRVSRRQNLSEALVGTGYPFRQLDHLHHYMEGFTYLVQHTAGLRRPGAASLDLACVASGAFDGFWELGLSSWDIAAGSLLIEEAGGVITTPEGQHHYLDSGNVIAGNAAIHSQLKLALNRS